MCRKSRALFLVYVCVSFLSFWAVKAQALPISEDFESGSFGPSWITVLNANIRPHTNAINTATGNAGFNGFFSSMFAVLGDNSGNINGLPNSGLSMIEWEFTLPAMIGTSAVESYDLRVSFRLVFDGDDSTNTIHDTFVVVLDVTTPVLSLDSTDLLSCGPADDPTCANVQIFRDTAIHNMSGVAPGSHVLTFALNETTSGAAVGSTNTAVGIDDISLTGEARLVTVTVPEPTSLALLGLGLICMSGVFIKNRKSYKR